MTTLSQAPKVKLVRWLFWADGFTPTPRRIYLSHRLRAHQVGSLVEHELVHVAQMQAHGWLTWASRYVFSRAWRLAYEVEAYVVSIEASHHTDGPDAQAIAEQLVVHHARYLAKWWRYWLFMKQGEVATLLRWAYANRSELRTKALCVATLVLLKHDGADPLADQPRG